MDVTDRIKKYFERNHKAIELRPSVGQGTAITKIRLLDGYRCEIEEGTWRMVADMGKKSGGDDSGPNPGILGRGALGSCLVQGYVMWAARLGVPIASLEVEVQADYDARGHYGIADVARGYTEVRYVVTVESDAPEADVMKLLDVADSHAPYYEVFAKPVTLKREVRLSKPEER